MSWSNENNKLVKIFEFNTFLEVIAFINAFAPICEDMQHHPDFKVYNYRFVKFELMTHDIGTVGPKDEELAKQLVNLYSRTKE